MKFFVIKLVDFYDKDLKGLDNKENMSFVNYLENLELIHFSISSARLTFEKKKINQ